MAAPDEIRQLVQHFDDNIEAYTSSAYNETQARIEFIDPLFKRLGWDIDNTQGFAEAYKDVVHEDAIKIGDVLKAPDYCFRVGGTRKFFLEAKRPAVHLKSDPLPAYQLRRYAWSAGLPLSILTNFAELAVYDCRGRPSQNDKASVARTLYLTYREYVDRWDEIAGIFGRDAVYKGSFDKYAESNKAKRGTATVDMAFLEEIEGWRETLARNFALRNPDLSQRELNYAVQATIDRILFLRMCEDRGIERYGQLLGVCNGPAIYPRLFQIFRDADDRYNSGLFYFHPEPGRAESPDELTPFLKLDDKPLKDIITSLYYPQSPYEFSVLSAEILGQVYERFLGKVIRLTEGHQAKVEEKPEVRKAGGVYYTPSYIVDYIVKNTVGKLLGPIAIENGASARPGSSARRGSPDPAEPPTEGLPGPHYTGDLRSGAWAGSGEPRPTPSLTARQAAKLRILDPACGSGSFLLGAYQYLLDWHRDWYVNDGPEKHAKELYQTAGNVWRLATTEKRRILLNNIYGVDIDPQAVEVTKLSLLLKVLEGESKQTLERQLKLFHERALPDLASNIKCGNSLIGPDFYENHQGTLFEEDEKYRLNVFDWNAEFPQIMKAGGFDAVIGNPPYIRMEEFVLLKSYLRKRYLVHDERTDFYAYFIEREHVLLREGGKFGMIVSNKFLRANYGRKVRQFLAKTAAVDRILDLAGLPVFRAATVRTLILLTTKGKAKSSALYSPPLDRGTFLSVESGTKTLQAAADAIAYSIRQSSFKGPTWHLNRREHAELLRRLQRAENTLAEVVDGKICRGIVSGLTEAFVISAAQRRDILAKNPEAKEIIRPFLQGRNIRRYYYEWDGDYLIYTHHGIDMKTYPKVIDHLRPFKGQLEARATKQRWYELQQPQLAYKEFLERPKIIFPDIATTCRFALDTRGHFGANTVYFLPTADLYLLGLLNSQLALFYFTETCAALEGAGEPYLRFFGQYLEGFPIVESSTAPKRREKIETLVEQTLALHRGLPRARTAHDKTALQRQIHAIDRQIDRLVYELYGLTEDEIKMVEEGDFPSKLTQSVAEIENAENSQ